MRFEITQRKGKAVVGADQRGRVFGKPFVGRPIDIELLSRPLVIGETVESLPGTDRLQKVEQVGR
jgi:hypothetical protein